MMQARIELIDDLGPVRIVVPGIAQKLRLRRRPEAGVGQPDILLQGVLGTELSDGCLGIGQAELCKQIAEAVVSLFHDADLRLMVSIARRSIASVAALKRADAC